MILGENGCLFMEVFKKDSINFIYGWNFHFTEGVPIRPKQAMHLYDIYVLENRDLPRLGYTFWKSLEYHLNRAFNDEG